MPRSDDAFGASRMKTRSWPLAVIALAIAGVLSCWLAVDMLRSSGRSRTSSAAPVVSPTQSPSAAAEVATPRVNAAPAKEVEQPASETDSDLDRAADEPSYRLEEAFLNDVAGGSASKGREAAVREVFASPAVSGVGGYLERIACKATVCRGELVLPDLAALDQTLSQLVLSGGLSQTVPGAFTLASRVSMPDGSLRAVFFVHPDDVLAGVGE